MQYGSGCLPSKVDLRDYVLKRSSLKLIPKEYKLLFTRTIKSQGQVQSCVAHAVSSILEYYNNVPLSTNFIYGIHNKLFGTVGPGMNLRDACKIVTEYGDMLESDCKGNNEINKVYQIAEDAFNNEDKLKEAYKYKTRKYINLKSFDDIKYFIINHGPVLLSIKWYENYTFNKNTLTIDSDLRGGYCYHAVMCYGYSELGLICQNSWGIKWGDNGSFILKYSDGFRNAYGLIDDEDLNGDSDIIEPVHNISILDKIYRLLNIIINKILKR